MINEELDFLRRQNKELRRLAEKAGNEIAQWKHKCLRLEEELKKLKGV